MQQQEQQGQALVRRELGIVLESGRVLSGALAGVIAGALFGMAMHVMGMMPMIGLIVGVESAAVGWGVHLVLSALFGAAFGAVVSTPSWGRGMGYAVGWGLILWAVGALVIMRLRLGMPIAFDDAAMMSLVGHVVWGLFLGGFYVAFTRRGTARPA